MISKIALLVMTSSLVLVYFKLYYGQLNSILSLITYNLHIQECARGVFNMISHDNLTCANTESKIVMPYN